MRRRTLIFFLLIGAAGIIAFAAATCAVEDAPRISREEVRALLGDPNVIILDARTGGSWSESDKKIKGAVRVDPDDVGSWAGNLPKGKKIVVYCS